VKKVRRPSQVMNRNALQSGPFKSTLLAGVPLMPTPDIEFAADTAFIDSKFRPDWLRADRGEVLKLEQRLLADEALISPILTSGNQ
jgi:hypothetical protein